ncbi:MAG: hypothetical protein ABSF67_24545, partial [Roseiarcus sp.]
QDLAHRRLVSAGQAGDGPVVSFKEFVDGRFDFDNPTPISNSGFTRRSPFVSATMFAMIF